MDIPTNFIIGHEFVGQVDEIGGDVKNFRVGDQVVVPFFTACGKCFFCKKKQSSRCANGKLFGNSQGTNSIPGGQADYVRVPNADTTMVLAPTTVPRELLVLMADIFPTGYFAASRFLKNLEPAEQESTVCAVVGCGPVGLCAVASALTMCSTVYAIDSVPERLQEAKQLGAIPLDLNEDPGTTVRQATGGRGADVVLEVVGNAGALDLSIDIARPFASISSVGVHTSTLLLAGPLLYGKNLTLAFGRCPVRSIFEEALEVLVKLEDRLLFLCGTKMKLEEANEAYRRFDAREVNKVVFDL
ncbi:hypothetical protein EKO04_003949 [Ascochyta lentis]|uniref:Alcohol dehydrogenase n=1 Tax=Ascochyta lentis TaxID=205686 RepID=A0A8H7J8L4_9PLEO|nr:hypothetical protein EKO04_003949 [Ascochyta lentis]